MKNIYLKSIFFGVSLGTTLLLIAPLGLGILLIEILRPILAPGAVIAQLILEDSGGGLLVLVALILNWIIFSFLFLGYFFIRRNLNA